MNSGLLFCPGIQAGSLAIRGIVTPMITPLLSREKLDVDGLERLTDRLIKGGVSGLFLLGTTGEFAAMSHKLRRKLIVTTMGIVRERIPVFVGISDTSIMESLQLANCAADAGATACVVTAPYYYHYAEPLMGDYLTEIAAKSPLPLILYNMPENTGVNFELETVRRVIQNPRFIAMKDSGGDLNYFAKVSKLASERSDFSLLMGPDTLLGQAMTLRAGGGVNSGSNLCPEIFVGMYNAALENDRDLMAYYQRSIELLNRIYWVPRQSLGVICGLKTALGMLGICNEYINPPSRGVGEDERMEIREIVKLLYPGVKLRS
ncbi:MAG: dihydrodipicolinate synthase family protein [Planctomycetia bacterium]|nr:dihydrodipicolinate synthase family protein [Planctomycetia bacterium]